MSVQDVVTRAIEAFNRHDADAFAALYADNATAIDPQYERPLQGKEQIRKDIADFFVAFPDARATVEALVTQGDRAAFEVEVTGTHRGPLVTPAGDVPATHRPVSMRGGRFIRVDARGRITECNRYFDIAAIMQQLGLSEAPAPESAV